MAVRGTSVSREKRPFLRDPTPRHGQRCDVRHEPYSHNGHIPGKYHVVVLGFNRVLGVCFRGSRKLGGLFISIKNFLIKGSPQVGAVQGKGVTMHKL